MFGTLANDSLLGTAGNDTILGLNGDDTIQGGPGADALFGDGFFATNIARVSTAANGVEANGASGGTFSPDGTKIIFGSSATNLVVGDTNGTSDVFIKDLATGVVTRISTDSSGGQLNYHSNGGIISGDGNSAFMFGNGHIIKKDLINGTMNVVSTTTNGSPVPETYFSVSSTYDGMKITFSSFNLNFTPGDTNNGGDAYVKDLATGVVTRITTDSLGNQGTGEDELGYVASQFSPDGSKVLFRTRHSNLVDDDTNGTYDLFIKDLVTGTTTCVSANDLGEVGNNVSTNGVFTPDGTKVLFVSDANNLVAGDTNNLSDLFIKDLFSNVVTRILLDPAGNQSFGADGLSLSPDGNKLVFHSSTNNVVAGDTNGAFDVFVKDLISGSLTRVSTDVNNLQVSGPSLSSSFSPDGTQVVFQSQSSGLVGGDTNGSQDIFIKTIGPIGTGNDSLKGNSGNDTLVGGAGADTLDGGADSDTVDYSAANTVVLVHLDGTQYVQWGSGTGGAIEQDTLVGIENAIGGSGADSIYGSNGANLLYGGASNDLIAADYGNDTIDGGDGNDFIDASYDADFVSGRTGDDTIYGGAHDDTVNGGDGADFLYGGHGADSLSGGAGADVLFVDSTDVFYNGGTGIDRIVWQDVSVAANLDITVHSADYFYGYTGDDSVTAVGATVRPELHGGGGNDTLSGSAGVGSILLGENGNDRLIGNTGIDHHVGGIGADIFSTSLNGGVDRVYDFSSVEGDKVEFNTIAGITSFANLTVNSAFSGSGWYGYGYGSGTMWVNTSASGGAALAAADFLFV